MKIKLFLTAVMAFFMTGCVTTRGGGWGSFSPMPALLTVVLTNNTTVALEVFENGSPVMLKDSKGKYHRVVLPSGNTVSRGYYNFTATRGLVITVKGICPPQTDQGNSGCSVGQYMGTESRTFQVRSNGSFQRAVNWEITNLRAPRGAN